MKLILLHGLGQHAISWQKVSEFLPKNLSAAYELAKILPPS